MSEHVVFENLVDMFLKSVERYRTNPLFGVKTGGTYHWLTYDEVGEQVKHFRGGLHSLGVNKGDRVAIIANNRVEWAVGAYATYSLGGQYVPLYEAQQPKDWQYILKDCGAKVLLAANQEIYDATKPFIRKIKTLKRVVNLDGPATEKYSYKALLQVGRDKPVDPVQPEQDDICGFIYTSGTTGNPKGVLLTHGNLVSNINAVHAIFPMDSDDVSLSFLPWAHSFGQTVELHTLLSYGAAMGLAESVETILTNLEEVRPTLLFSVPRIFNRIYDAVQQKMHHASPVAKKLMERTLEVAVERGKLEETQQSSLLLEVQHKVLDKLVASKIRARFGGRLRYAFSGGAALSKEVGEFIDNLGIIVYEGYGLTETSPIVSGNRPGVKRIGSVGKVIPHVRVVTEPTDSSKEGEGELVVYGPNIMQGYHNLPEETAKVMTEDGGFRTGDLGRIDEDGFIFITGRVKELYKLENGKYVAPAPLEEKLKLSSYIDHIMIDGSNRPYNVAVVVPNIDRVRDWATEHSVRSANDEELCADARVKTLLENEIEQYSSAFKGFERVRNIFVAPEPFSIENDMLTPTLKLKRRIVMEKYGEDLTGLYGAA